MDKVKAFFWDVDGLLVDTEKIHFLAWRALLDEFGRTLTLEEYVPLVGQGGEENMRYICESKKIDGSIEELTARRRTHYLRIREKGIIVLEDNVRLAREGAEIYKNALRIAVSSAREKDVLMNIKAAGLESFFHKVISWDGVTSSQRKPSSYAYLEAVREANINPEEGVAFEDSSSGVRAAKGASLKCVALPNEMTSVQDFSRADLVVNPDQKKDMRQIVGMLGFANGNDESLQN
jgi:beta-phosphoglucomutase-like phosphatase (HAD superfamily)